jgi:hypothetical protein
MDARAQLGLPLGPQSPPGGNIRPSVLVAPADSHGRPVLADSHGRPVLAGPDQPAQKHGTAPRSTRQ